MPLHLHNCVSARSREEWLWDDFFTSAQTEKQLVLCSVKQIKALPPQALQEPHYTGILLYMSSKQSLSTESLSVEFYGRFYSSPLCSAKCRLELCDATVLCHPIPGNLRLLSLWMLWLQEQCFKVSLLGKAQTENSYSAGWKRGGHGISYGAHYNSYSRHYRLIL